MKWRLRFERPEIGARVKISPPLRQSVDDLREDIREYGGMLAGKQNDANRERETQHDDASPDGDGDYQVGDVRHRRSTETGYTSGRRHERVH